MRIGSQTVEVQQPNSIVLRLVGGHAADNTLVIASPIAPLEAKTTPEEKLHALLQSMKEACQDLSHPQKEQVLAALNSWEIQFFQGCQIDSPVDSERKKTALAVSALYFKIVEFTMLNIAQNEDEKIVWLKFYDEVKDFFAKIMPSDQTVDEFLAVYQARELKKLYLLEIPKVQALFQDFEDQLFANANQTNELLMQGFEKLENEFLDLQSERQLTAQQFQNRVNSLTVKITNLFQEFEKSLKIVQEIGNQMELNEQFRDQYLNTAENLTYKF